MAKPLLLADGSLVHFKPIKGTSILAPAFIAPPKRKRVYCTGSGSPPHIARKGRIYCPQCGRTFKEASITPKHKLGGK